MKQKAFDCTVKAIEECKAEKDVATRIKQEFDALDENQSSWHCIVGKHFAVSITHAAKYLIFFQCRSHTVLLFK
jgi:dynein light chain LC8-type